MAKRQKDKEESSEFSGMKPEEERARPSIENAGIFLMQQFPFFSAMPNILERMLPSQRQFFLESLNRQSPAQKMAVEKDRAQGKEKALSRLIPTRTQSISAQAAAMGVQAAAKASVAAQAVMQPAIGASAYSGMPALAMVQAVAVQQGLSQAIFDYAGNDPAKAGAVMKEFESRLKSSDYKTDDLMGTLLLVIEDQIWGAEEGGIESTKPTGAGAKIHTMKPEMMRTSLQESSEVRLASVREMLRYYFARHPAAFCRVLALVLGVSADRENDSVYMGERLAVALAHMGSFALEMKILAELKRMEDMDDQKCMRELGFKYDEKKKKLIIGKRTCGGPLAPKDILMLLFSRLNRKNN